MRVNATYLVRCDYKYNLNSIQLCNFQLQLSNHETQCYRDDEYESNGKKITDQNSLLHHRKYCIDLI
jgi:hypothetical protein